MATGRSADGDRAALVWERPEPVGRTGAAPVPSATIAEAAMGIADREGLHAVSVKRVASKLGMPATRLDTYLPTRDDLLDLMLDGAFGEIEIPERDAEDDWRTDLAIIAEATQRTAINHPWLRTLAGTRTPCGPNGLRNSERVLAAMDGVDADAATKTNAVNTVLAYVYGFVQLEMAHTARKGDDVEGDLARRSHTAAYLVEAVTSGDYPRLTQVFSDATSLNTADAFGTGLGYVLDGIAQTVGGGYLPAGDDGVEDEPDEEPSLVDSLLDDDGSEQSDSHKRRRGLRRG